MMQLEKPQNHCYGACFPLEIAPQLPYRKPGWLHDVADHYILEVEPAVVQAFNASS
jgi:hypothetical protein